MISPPARVALHPEPRSYKVSIDVQNTAEYFVYRTLLSKVSRLLMKSHNKQSPARDSSISPEKKPQPAQEDIRTNDQPAPNGVRPLVLERRQRKDSSADTSSHVRELEILAQNLIQTSEQQQQGISRELHDNIAQVLAATTNRLTLARNEKMPAWLRQELLDLRALLEGALHDVRTLARDLRPALLDHFGFAAALERHADAFRQRSRITLEIRIEPDAVNFLDCENLTHLFRLAQEALQNIEDHSAATQAWFTLVQNDGTMHLEIGDNGRAFTPERVAEAQGDGHLGLLGIRERAELLGGSLLLEAVPDQGTTIRVEIPVPPPPTPAPQNLTN